MIKGREWSGVIKSNWSRWESLGVVKAVRVYSPTNHLSNHTRRNACSVLKRQGAVCVSREDICTVVDDIPKASANVGYIRYCIVDGKYCGERNSRQKMDPSTHLVMTREFLAQKMGSSSSLSTRLMRSARI